jgi:hypothetical protein
MVNHTALLPTTTADDAIGNVTSSGVVEMMASKYNSSSMAADEVALVDECGSATSKSGKKSIVIGF